ncbi:hypothetical protein BJV82DRAFT_668543 [Fennellomyces sp. T-0311]|nr:hypothetical protein BJV82DRAFT_668543 [Fennellomyces sp. T-0311]
MKASYIVALFAVLAVSVNASPVGQVKDSKVQVQQANGNNAEYSGGKGGSLLDLSNLLGGGINIGSKSSKDTTITQNASQ